MYLNRLYFCLLPMEAIIFPGLGRPGKIIASIGGGKYIKLKKNCLLLRRLASICCCWKLRRNTHWGSLQFLRFFFRNFPTCFFILFFLMLWEIVHIASCLNCSIFLVSSLRVYIRSPNHIQANKNSEKMSERIKIYSFWQVWHTG